MGGPPGATSRLCVKGIPPHLDNKRFREHFSEVAEVARRENRVRYSALQPTVHACLRPGLGQGC